MDAARHAQLILSAIEDVTDHQESIARFQKKLEELKGKSWKEISENERTGVKLT